MTAVLDTKYVGKEALYLLSELNIRFAATFYVNWIVDKHDEDLQ